jgi:ParB-like chromosome segregation protein Spo0J
MSPSHVEYEDNRGQNAKLVDDSAVVARKIRTPLLLDPVTPMRHNIDDAYILELMADIKQTGLLHPLCVVPVLNGVRVRLVGEARQILDQHEARGGMYRVAAGHCRLISCRNINLAEVDCRVWCDTSVTESQIMAAENTHRSDPSDFDLAVMYAEWLKEPGLTEAELCRRAGKSPEFIYARAELLEGWEFVAMALHEKKIKFAVARAINKEPDENYAKHFLNMAIDQGATSRLVTAWVQEHAAHVAMAVAPGPEAKPGITTPAVNFAPPECIACGERQSYNLETVIMCGNCAAQVRQLRASQEAEAAPAPGQ